MGFINSILGSIGEIGAYVIIVGALLANYYKRRPEEGKAIGQGLLSFFTRFMR